MSHNYEMLHKNVESFFTFGDHNFIFRFLVNFIFEPKPIFVTFSLKFYFKIHPQVAVPKYIEKSL